MADHIGNQQSPDNNQGVQQQSGKKNSPGGGIGNNGEQDRGKRSVNEPGAARNDPDQNLR